MREGQHLKTLLTLTISTKEERTFTGKSLEHVLDGHIFYPVSTRSPSIKEMLEHTPITGKNTFKLIIFVYDNGIFPKSFHRISLPVHSQYTLKNKETHTPNTLIRINTNGTILTRITDLFCFLTTLAKTKAT